ncbi:antibiotic biosynthesis monooxygenase [Streptomyces sp. SAJ15]|uniref:antibiotic biosynthesis monooxygenase family protein n=1 Tax=Streptomyces sp. SAJ15 TaxID=2011095 RepID=UPI001184FA12|nr:antibiotic biosynthesis monooxygenase [Streptomyces sp. SAJ15]TVL88161.1 antibiotic biosynthesis monooxygenase [Streptomyces sp. SAJ15]
MRGTGSTRVVIYYRVPEGSADALISGYHASSAALKGTSGLLGNELLRNAHDPRRYAVLSEWEDLAAFQTWEAAKDHRGQTAPVREFVDPDPRPFAVYEVVASYSA